MASKPVHGHRHAHHHAHRAPQHQHAHQEQKAHKSGEKPVKAEKQAAAPQATPPQKAAPAAAPQPAAAPAPTPTPAPAPADQFTPPTAAPVDLAPGATGERPAPPSVTAGAPATAAGTPAAPQPALPDPNQLSWISQLAPTGASADYCGQELCGPTAGAMIARATGYESTLSDGALVEKLAGYAQTSPVIGTTGNGMIAMYEEMGLQTASTPGADMDWINTQLAAGHYVTALGNYYAVPGRVSDQTAGHYLDVTSYQAATQQQAAGYMVSDPADQGVNWLTVSQLQSFITSAPLGGFAISAWQEAAAAAAAVVG